MRENEQVTPKRNEISGLVISESPSLMVFHDTLYLAHQGNSQYGGQNRLWYVRSADGINWSPDIRVPGVTMTGSPAMAVFNDRLYIAHRGNEGEWTSVWYTSSSDGNNWASDAYVPNVVLTEVTSDSPSLAVLNNELWLAYRGTDSNVWYAKFDGSRWSSPIATQIGKTPVAPALGVYPISVDTLYIGFLYEDENAEDNNIPQFLYTSDERNWAFQGVSGCPPLITSPGMTSAYQLSTSFVGQVAPQSGSNGWVCINQAGESTNSGGYQPATNMAGSPALVCFKDSVWWGYAQKDGSVVVEPLMALD